QRGSRWLTWEDTAMADVAYRRPEEDGEGTMPTERASGGISRRRMLGYLIAAPTLVAGARWAADPQTARAALPTVQPIDGYDLTDLLTDSTRPTWELISLTVHRDGTVSFALPRSENGQ